MSHYLQRLAASVLQPGGRVHPVLDPVFAPPTIRVAAPFEEEVTATQNLRPQQPRTLKDPTYPHATAIPNVNPSQTGSATVVDSIAPDERISAGEIAERPPVAARHEPPALMPPARATPAPLGLVKAPDGAAPAMPQTVSGKNDPQIRYNDQRENGVTPDQPTRWINEPQGGSNDLEMVEQKQSPNHVPAPLIPESLARQLPKPSPLLLTVLGPGKPFGGERQHGPPSAASEPDEVQIHIGRIEVTAVQAGPAVTVASRPPRWSPSLQEYLRRRDRKG
jgi:hypothetical protein